MQEAFRQEGFRAESRENLADAQEAISGGKGAGMIRAHGTMYISGIGELAGTVVLEVAELQKLLSKRFRDRLHWILLVQGDSRPFLAKFGLMFDHLYPTYGVDVFFGQLLQLGWVFVTVPKAMLSPSKIEDVLEEEGVSIPKGWAEKKDCFFITDRQPGSKEMEMITSAIEVFVRPRPQG